MGKNKLTNPEKASVKKQSNYKKLIIIGIAIISIVTIGYLFVSKDSTSNIGSMSSNSSNSSNSNKESESEVSSTDSITSNSGNTNNSNKESESEVSSTDSITSNSSNTNNSNKESESEVSSTDSITSNSSNTNNSNKESESEVSNTDSITSNTSNSNKESKSEVTNTTPSDTVVGIEINKAELSATAKFYPYESDGIKMEVLALKAKDGTIRTALNTCQVCYASGKGYYVQEGDVLVCQNCGNRFTTDMVGKSKGGCNPVPISDASKVDDGTKITIDKKYLDKNKAYFSNWKV